MKLREVLITSTLITSTSAVARSDHHALVCNELGAFVKASYVIGGCTLAPKPHYNELHLSSTRATSFEEMARGVFVRGTIEASIDYSWHLWPPDPNCHNPRGSWMTHYLALPVDQGIWDVTINDQYLGTVQTTPSCVLTSAR